MRYFYQYKCACKQEQSIITVEKKPPVLCCKRCWNHPVMMVIGNVKLVECIPKPP